MLLLSFLISCQKSTNETAADQNAEKLKQYAQKYLQNASPSLEVMNSNSMIGGDDCVPSSQVNCIEFPLQTKAVYLPDYDCYATVTYKWKYCITIGSNGATTANVFFYNFHAIADPNSCANLLTFWGTLANQLKWEELNFSIDEFNEAAAKALEKLELTLFNQGAAGWFNCGTGNTLLYSDFYKPNCFKYCYKVINGQFSIVYPNDPCGSGCCLRKSQYCYNTATGNMDLLSTTNETIGTCTVINPNTSCPPGYNTLPKQNCQRQCTSQPNP